MPGSNAPETPVAQPPEVSVIGPAQTGSAFGSKE